MKKEHYIYLRQALWCGFAANLCKIVQNSIFSWLAKCRMFYKLSEIFIWIFYIKAGEGYCILLILTVSDCFTSKGKPQLNYWIPFETSCVDCVFLLALGANCKEPSTHKTASIEKTYERQVILCTRIPYVVIIYPGQFIVITVL